MTTKVPRFHPELKAGERVRLSPDGTLYRVARVTPGAAYLKPVHSAPVEVTVNGKTFLASEGGSMIQVSAHAAVYRYHEPSAPTLCSICRDVHGLEVIHECE